MNVEERLRTERISKLLLTFSVPSIISLVITAVYNMVDQIFIGQGVGYLGNGATNVIYPLTQVALALGLMIGEGGANYISLHLGAGERDKVSRAAAASIAALLGCGILLAAVYLAFLEPLCILFGATEQTLPYALDYGRIISLGMIWNVFSIGSTSLVRADGQPGMAMGGMIAGFVVNIIGDPVAIFLLGMGVKGAAWATILGQMATAVVNIIALRRCRTIPLDHSSFSGCVGLIPAVAKGGLSSFMSQFTIVIVSAVQNNLYVYYGAQSIYGSDIPMTTMGVTVKIFVVVQCFALGLSSGSQPIIGYNYGRGLYQRVKDTYKTILVASALFLLAATLWFQLAPMSIVRLFGESDPLYLEFAVKCLRIYLLLIVVDVFQMTGSIFLQSLGQPVRAAVLTLIRQLIIVLPAMFLLGRWFGVEGLLWSGPVSMGLTAIVAVAFLRKAWKGLSEGGKKAGGSHVA